MKLYIVLKNGRYEGPVNAVGVMNLLQTPGGAYNDHVVVPYKPVNTTFIMKAREVSRKRNKGTMDMLDRILLGNNLLQEEE